MSGERLETLKQAMELAVEAAAGFLGSTAPNPAVGAVGLAKDGKVLSIQAHERAGSAHAEAKVIEDLRQKGRLSELHTLVVTLEPCNHQGQTPACSEAILGAKIPEVIFGCLDPNPKVVGGGRIRLAQAGVRTQQIETSSCRELLQSFSHFIRTGIPWVRVKTAYREVSSPGEPPRWTLIPLSGQKTFTGEEALRFAHELRRRSDAFITGSGTVLADHPQFTVRKVPDHPGKARYLAILDRRKRVPKSLLHSYENSGFSIIYADSFEDSLVQLGQKGCLEVLVEAGPALSASILSGSFWNEHVIIRQKRAEAGKLTDEIEMIRNVHWNYPSSGPSPGDSSRRPHSP